VKRKGEGWKGRRGEEGDEKEREGKREGIGPRVYL